MVDGRVMRMDVVTGAGGGRVLGAGGGGVPLLQLVVGGRHGLVELRRGGRGGGQEVRRRRRRRGTARLQSQRMRMRMVVVMVVMLGGVAHRCGRPRVAWRERPTTRLLLMLLTTSGSGHVQRHVRRAAQRDM